MSHPNLYTRDQYRGSVVLMEIAIFPFVAAIFFSVNLKIQINTKLKEIREIYNIGFFKFSGKIEANNLNYISVFYQADIDIYTLMLWYKGNKHQVLCGFKDLDSVMVYGVDISNKLNIDLLDATEKGNFKWVDKSE